MQPGQHIHPHGYVSHEDAFQSFWHRLAILRCFGNGGKQRGLDQPKIEISDAPGYTDDSLGFKRTFKAMV